MLPRKIAIILYGPPGSGKGTQANLIADKLDLVHVDTGKFLESIVYDLSRQKEKIIRRERKNFEDGILITPSFVVGEIKRRVRRIWESGLGVAFSGSPRTLYEAEREMPFFEKLYGKKNIFVFVISVSERVSLKRNSHRVVCTICRAPLLTAYYPSKNPKHCPICGGPFYRRTLDKPDVIKVRLKQYRDRTKPVFAFMKKRGYRVRVIDGGPEPYKVFRSVYGHLKK